VRHPVRWIVIGVAVVLVAAVGFGAWYVLGDDAPAKPALAVTGTTGGGPSSINGKWVVAPGKDVYLGYRMTEVFAGDIVHKTAVGRTPKVSGNMTIAADKVTSVVVQATMTDLKSDRGARDNYIHTHGIDSDKYPTATFKLTEPITLPQPVPKGEKVKVSATGALTLHGVTKTVTVPLDAQWSGPTIQVVGTAPIVLADYKIEPPKTSVVSTDDHGSLELSLTFVPAS
jgi:polyisoprenoid-binding protein YceI